MRTVFITGATGAVGSALVPLFLEEADTAVRLLVRAESADRLRARLGELCAFWGLSPQAAPVAGRVEALAGDVSVPRLGLSEADFRRLAGEVTHVVHSAGVVKLNQPIEAARASAVESARQVVALCRAAQAGGSFRKLEFVSTVGVGGRTSGLIPEQPIRHARQFHNTYEAAKAEAEEYLFGEMAAGLAATVHRPSMVVGDARTGKVVHFQVFYYLTEFFCGLRTWGVVPRTGGVRLDIIPSDYVAGVIHRSSGRDDAAGRIFHLCSGPGAAPRVSELTARLRDLMHRRGRMLPRLWRLPPSAYRVFLKLVGPWVGPKTRRSLESLPVFIDYLMEEQVFDNAQAQSFFSPLGLAVPRPEDYLERIMDYYWERKRAPRGAAPSA
jgi:thioester reductase-like protein